MERLKKIMAVAGVTALVIIAFISRHIELVWIVR